jgi:hypothetical protein
MLILRKGRLKEKDEKEEGRITIFLLCKALQVLIRDGMP